MWIAVFAILFFAATSGPGEGVLSGPETNPSNRAHWIRHGMWSTFFLTVLPMLVWRGAVLGESWRARDGQWLGALPWKRSAIAFACALGTSAAALAASGVAFGVIVLSAERPVEGARYARTLQHPALFLPDDAGVPPPQAQLSLIVDDDAGMPSRVGPRTRALQVAPTVAPGSGAAVDLRLVLRSRDGQEHSSERRIFARTPMRLELVGVGPWQLEFHRGPGAVVFLPRSSIRLLHTEESWFGCDVGFFWRSALGLMAWGVLAMGLGAWMRLSLAIGTCLSLASVPWCFDVHKQLLPAGDFMESLALLADGVTPGPTPHAMALGTLVFLLLAALLLRGALREGALRA